MKTGIFILAGLLVLGLALLLPYRNFVGDDAFIHLRYIENLYQDQGFSFNPGEPSYGSTSPLWVLLLATLRPLFSNPVFALKLVALVLALGAIIFFFLLSRQYFQEPVWVIAAGVLFVLDPWFIKWTMSGMENGLNLVLLLSGFWWYLRQRNSGKSNWLSPILLGLCWLTRPEIVFFLGLIFSDVLLFETKKKKANLALLAVLVVAVMSPWLIYAYSNFSTVIPNTMLARNADETVSLPFTFTLTKTAKILFSNNLLELVVILLAGVASLNKSWRERFFPGGMADYFVPVLWPVLLIAFYLAGKTNVMARYLLMVTPFMILLGLRALRAGLETVMRRPRVRLAALGVFCVLVAAQLIFVQAKYTFFVTKFSNGMDDNLIDIGLWFAQNTPPETVIAAHEIGAIGYFSQRKILDFSGLVCPEIVPYIRERRTFDFIKERKPDYLVHQSWEEFDLLKDPNLGAHLSPLFAKRVQREGSSVVGNKEIMSVYKTHF
ncbi:MAG: hypothetical protein ACREOO_05235 [bacterium]